MQKINKNDNEWTGSFINTQNEGVIGRSLKKARALNTQTQTFTFYDNSEADILDQSCEWVLDPQWIMPYCVLMYPKKTRDIVVQKQRQEEDNYVSRG